MNMDNNTLCLGMFAIPFVTFCILCFFQVISEAIQLLKSKKKKGERK